MTQAATTWNLQGDYFENCNCDFLCPCLFAPGGPLTELPTDCENDDLPSRKGNLNPPAGTSAGPFTRGLSLQCGRLPSLSAAVPVHP